MFRLTLALAAVAASALAIAAGAFAGVSGPSIYVDGTLYRTVGTPTDLSNTGAPDSTFQTIYDFSGGQMPPLYQDHNVADAAPGDPGFHGGRWRVHALSFANYGAALAAYDKNSSGNFDSAAEVEAALTGGVGGAEDLGVVKSFECPLIPVPGGGH
jgi:hypothetical protein